MTKVPQHPAAQLRPGAAKAACAGNQSTVQEMRMHPVIVLLWGANSGWITSVEP